MAGKKVKKAKKPVALREHKNQKVAFNLRMSGVLMMLASTFMIAVPFMYRGTYNFVANHTDIPRTDDVIVGGVLVGVVFALIYCMLGLYMFKAGEEGTFITKGLTVMNNIVVLLAVIAAVLVFLPIPDQTFNYAVKLYTSGSITIPSGIIPMGILTIIDIACIVGLTGAVALIDDVCVFKKNKKD